MTIWQPPLAGGSGPKFKQISDAIGADIAGGRLAVGDRLPPQRDLAYALGVSLNTVSRAYADATERGLLSGEVGRGTYVRAAGPLPAQADAADMTRLDAGPIDFSRNLPAPGRSAEALARSLGDLRGANDLASFLDYQTTGDRDAHADAAVTWLAKVGLNATGETVVLTSGAQHGLMVALLATMRPGDVLLAEALTYAPLKAMAQHLGLKIVPVALDDGVLDPEALDAVCTRVAAKTLYCLPTLHTPTTATMDAARRSAVAGIARKHDLIIIEDDVFGPLPPDRPLPLACFAPERTVYLTSVSKCLAPGLRVGFIHAPVDHARSLRAAVNLTCWMPPPLMAEIASRWIGDGTADRLTAFQRDEAAARQAMARDLLPAGHARAHPTGFHVWLTLPSQWHPDAFRMAAEERGVKVLAGAAFAVQPSHSPGAVRLCLSYERSRARVQQGLATIAALLEDTGQAGAMIL